MRILFDCSSLFRNGRVESGIPTYSLSVFELLKQTGHEIIPFYSGLKTYGLERIVGSFLHLPLPTKFIQVLTFCGVNVDWLIRKFSHQCHCEDPALCGGRSNLWFRAIQRDCFVKPSSFVSTSADRHNDKSFDLFFTPNISTFYRYFSSHINVVGVVHDLSQTLFPELKPWNERWKYAGQHNTHIAELFAFWNRNRKPVLKRFHRLIAISEHTKRDLVEFSNVPKEKITVIYPHGTWNMEHGTGDTPILSPPCEGEDVRGGVLAKFGVQKSYLLFLGHIEPRKNVENLIRAFSILKETNKELQLVIAGRAGYGFKKLLKICKELNLTFHNSPQPSLTLREGEMQISPLKIRGDERGVMKEVVFTNHISDEEKYTLMQNAEVFVYPSLYEGFAYPCLEAMSVGTPVVTSPVSALPEVLGDAALYADPLRPVSIATVVGEVLNDPELRTRLIQKGKECVAKYQNREKILQDWRDFFKTFETEPASK